jgi:imidazolonepropionase-like amidohydrolase
VPSPGALRDSERVALGASTTPVATPGVVKHGYVGIANGCILSVSEKQPVIPGATFVNTEGIILPGFVDVQPRDLER